MINQIYELTRQDFEEDPVSIWNCIFRKFYLPDQYGATIYTQSFIQIYNSLFFDIFSCGGSFYTENIVTANYLTFENVKSNSSSCFISKVDNSINIVDNSTNLTNILIVNAIADRNFGFLNDNNNATFFSYSNVTNCQSNKLNGMFEQYYSDSLIKFCYFSFIKSPTNSILISSLSKECQISYCLFHSISYIQNLFKTVNVTDVCLKFCQFTSLNHIPINKQKKDAGNSLIEILNNINLIINDCCFDKKEEEVFKELQSKNFINNNNFYENKKCFVKVSLLSKPFNKNIGYSYQRTPTYIVNIAPTPTHNYVLDKSNKSYEFLDISIDITFKILCCLIVLIICIIFFDFCNYFFPQLGNIFNFKNSKEML